MVNVEAVMKILGKLSLLKFFPVDAEARAALLELVCEKSPTEEQVRWVVNRILESNQEWPGPAAVLRLFDSPMMPGNMKPLSEGDRQKVLGVGEQKLTRELPRGTVTADPFVQTGFEILVGVQKAKEQNWDRPLEPEEIKFAPKWLRKLEGYE